MESNYDKMRKQAQKAFLTYDQEQIAGRFGLSMDDRYLSFRYMGSDCRIHRESGAVECFHVNAFKEADYNEAMTVYDLLCYAKPEAYPSGQYASMQSLSGILTVGAKVSSKGFFASEKKKYDHQEEKLIRALQFLGGEITEGGDVAAFIEVFRGLKLMFRFWNSDEEFAPDIQFLWDKNVLLYMHYETVWYANQTLITRINEAMKA